MLGNVQHYRAVSGVPERSVQHHTGGERCKYRSSEDAAVRDRQD